ncbi:MAG TPA: TonB-dependent copper receptor [Opitutaceae bacterium]|nr:TonB-dependent copper receptor [Opitutaceae bacterium]
MPILAEDPTKLEPYVVTAPRGDAPLTVTTDPKAPAQPLPAHDGADVLKSIPGFSVIRKGGTDGDPVFRGMAGSRVVVALDGQCVLGGCGNRMDPPTAYAFPGAYDRVTILKGPQTVLHGPGNSAAVVLFENDPLRYAAPVASLRSSLVAGSDGRFDALLDARAGRAEGYARVDGTYTRGDDYADGSGRDVHSAYERWSTNAAVGWTPDAHTTIEFSGARSDGEAAYADRAMDGVKFDRENLGLKVKREVLSDLVRSVELQLGYNYVDHVMDNYSLRPFVATAMMPAPAVSNPDRRTLGGRALVRLAPAESTQLALGVDHQENRHSVRSTSNETAMPYEAKARTRDADFAQWGAFGELTQKFGDADRLVGGFRLDRWRATDRRTSVAVGMMGSASNPTAGQRRSTELPSGFLRYERDLYALPGTVYLGLGRSERFPDYWELIKNESATSVSAFRVPTEKTVQLDAGLGLRTEKWALNASLFANRIDDFLLVQSGFAKPAGMTGTRAATITRAIDAETWGGELSANYRLTQHWRVDTTLAYTRGRNRTDFRPLAQIPPLEGRFALAYTQASWSAAALLRAVARQDRVAIGQGNIVGQDIGATPGFAVVSLNASWRVRPWARLSAGVDNVFDKTYAEHISRAGAAVSGFEQTTRVNEPGRTLWTRLDVSF